MENKSFNVLYNNAEKLKYEERCLEQLKKYLLKQGYPAESFHYPFHFDSIYCDLLISNPETNEPLIYFEVKTKESMNNGYRYYQKYKSNISNALFYLIYLDETKELKLIKMYPSMPFSKFMTILNSNYTSTLPLYKEIVKEQFILEKEKKKKSIKKKRDLFSLWCNGITLAIIILFILELFDVFRWTTERIVIIVLISFIPVLPLFAEIKIGDYTFKRKKQD
ncbi:MAG: hypothetical protein HFH08_02160 [Bacilli bacterium]|nr:hypothetical protein [Bacilli bacterium]